MHHNLTIPLDRLSEKLTRDKFIASINVFSCTRRSQPTAAVVCYSATIAMETMQVVLDQYKHF